MQHNQNDGQRQFAEHDGETGQITRYAAEFPSEFTPQREEEQNERRGHHESADGGKNGGSCQKENAEHSKNDGAALLRRVGESPGKPVLPRAGKQEQEQ